MRPNTLQLNVGDIMRSKTMAALAAMSLVASTTSAIAATPVVADRAGQETADESELFALAGGGLWVAIIGLALIAAFLVVAVEDDDINLPSSP